MSEHKRTSLTTIGTNKRDKKPKQQSKTLRFVLSLPEPNEEACPEFNYTELLKSAERKSKASGDGESGELNGLDPLAEDDDEQVRQIARHFEAKYGGSSKKKHGRYEDYVDVGAGYDETDPFIDNTDAYDEVVPEEMTTAHGGFYINCGPLEFRKVADYSDGEDDLKDNRPKKVKRTLSAGEGNESDGKTNYANCSKKAKIEGDEVVNRLDMVKKKDVALEEHEVHKKKRRRQHLNADDLQRKKAATVKELLKEKREFLELDNVPPGPEVAEPKKSISTSEPDKRVNSSITDIIESVVNAAHANEDSNKESESSVTKSMPESVVSDSDNSHDGQGHEANEKEMGEMKDDSKLPDNLSEELYEYIEALKKAAKTSAEGKCKFFSCTVNTILLRVEKACQDLPTSVRQNIYAHLGTHLPCTKDTLMKRAKKLHLEQEEAKIRKPLCKLKAAIDDAMPAVLENYTRACQKAMEEKSVDDSNEGAEAKKVSVKSKVPKRKFPWTEEIRMLFRQVVQQKIQCLSVLRPRRELPRDVLINFLEKEVRVLWPPGWMKVAILLHHCQDVLAHPVSRTKRAPQVVKKVPAVCTSASSVPSSQVVTSISVSRPSVVTQVTTLPVLPVVSILKPATTALQGQNVITTINNMGARIAGSTFTSPSTSNSIMSTSISVTPSASSTKFLKAVTSVSSSATISASTSRLSNSGVLLVHTQSASAAARPVVKSSIPTVSSSVQVTTVTPSISMSKPTKNVTPVVCSHAASVTPTVNSSKHTKNSTPSLPVLSQLSASVSITPTISRTKSATPLAPSTMPSSTTVMLNKTVYGDVTITKASNSNVEKVVDKPLSLSSTVNSKPKRSCSPVTLDLSPNRMTRTPSPIITVGNPSKLKGAVDLSVNKTSPPSVSAKSSSPSLSLNIPDCISVLPSAQSSTPSASTTLSALTVTPTSHGSLKQRILKDGVTEVSSGVDVGLEVIEIRTGPKGSDSNAKNSNAKPRSKRVEHTAITKTEHNTVSDGLRPNVVYNSSLKEEPPISEKEAEIRLNEEQETEAATDILSQLINESLTGGASREQVVESPQPCGSIHAIDGAEELAAAKSDSHDPPQPADAEKSVQLEMARVMEKLMELQNSSSDTVVEVMGIPDSVTAQQQTKQEVKHHSSKHKESVASSKRINTVPRRPSRGGFQEEFQKHVLKREEESNSYEYRLLPTSTAVAAHYSNSQVNNQSISDECMPTDYTNPNVQKTMPAMIPSSEMGYTWSGSGDVDHLTGFHFLGQLLFDKSAATHPSSHAGSNQHSSS